VLILKKRLFSVVYLKKTFYEFINFGLKNNFIYEFI